MSLQQTQELKDSIEEIVYAVEGFSSSDGDIGMSSSEAVDKLLKIISSSHNEVIKEMMGKIKEMKNPTITGGIINKGENILGAEIRGYNQALNDVLALLEKEIHE